MADTPRSNHPVPVHATAEDARFNVTFDHTVYGLIEAGGGAVQRFIVVGADGEYHWADAQILMACNIRNRIQF